MTFNETRNRILSQKRLREAWQWLQREFFPDSDMTAMLLGKKIAAFPPEVIAERDNTMFCPHCWNLTATPRLDDWQWYEANKAKGIVLDWEAVKRDGDAARAKRARLFAMGTGKDEIAEDVRSGNDFFASLMALGQEKKPEPKPEPKPVKRNVAALIKCEQCGKDGLLTLEQVKKGT